MNDVRWPRVGSYFYRRGSDDYRVMTLRRGKKTTITVDTERELREELEELESYMKGDSKLVSYPINTGTHMGGTQCLSM